MSDKAFIRIFSIILILGFVATAAHLFYAYKAYENSSIIHFISKEIW
ncbi:MAG: hypothetical protein J6U23_05270 [Clostridiales bacterium]|nr:hypothetical protein [Clostridiales bacterium]